jgi:hypothetical protein
VKGGRIMTRIVELLVAAGLLATLSVAPSTATSQEELVFDRSASLSIFSERIAEYAARRAELEALLPELKPSTDPAVFIAHRLKLAAAIKTVRPIARQGDFFTRGAGQVFRARIAKALQGRDVEKLLQDLFDEHPLTWGYHVRVYDSYPVWATREVPPILLQRLPELPDGIEYRVVDHDLAIVDTRANLILDVLPAAIARSDS